MTKTEDANLPGEGVLLDGSLHSVLAKARRTGLFVRAAHSLR